MNTQPAWADHAARRREALAFFEANQDALRCVLISLYRLSGPHSLELEQYLSDWFEMFSTRPATAQIPIASLRLPLVIAACRVGCIYAISQLADVQSEDKRFREFLRVDPELIGQEVEEKLKLGLAPDAKWDKPRPKPEKES